MRARFTWGRLWSYIGLFVAIGLSVAANIAAVVLPPPGSPTDWSAPSVLIIGAGIVPGLLAIGFEVLMRARWVQRYKYGRWAMAAVVLLPGVVSFQHMSHLLMRLGENHTVSILFPVAIDALGVMCAFALLSEKAADQEAGLTDLRPRHPYPPAPAGPFPAMPEPRVLTSNGHGR